MNENQFKGKWKVIKGKVKNRWGELTDDDLDRVEGRTEQLAGVIQQRYGRSQEEARREVRDWQDQL